MEMLDPVKYDVTWLIASVSMHSSTTRRAHDVWSSGPPPPLSGNRASRAFRILRRSGLRRRLFAPSDSGGISLRQVVAREPGKLSFSGVPTVGTHLAYDETAHGLHVEGGWVVTGETRNVVPLGTDLRIGQVEK